MLTALAVAGETPPAAEAAGTVDGFDAATGGGDDGKHGPGWIAKAILPNGLDESTCQALREDLLTMAQSMDLQTAAGVAGHVGPRGLPVDALREGVWIVRAWDLSGYHDLAEKRISFYRACMRKEDHPRRPAGSWPVACFTDGTEAVPDVILDPGIGAWILSMFWRHAQALSEHDGRAFLSACWPSVELAVDFLAGWMDARSREPLPGFDGNRWRDAVSDVTILEHFMGVDSGLRIAETLAKTPRAAWNRRKRELDALIRFHYVEKGGQWIGPAVLPFWQDEFREGTLPPWDKVVGQRVFSTEAEVTPSPREICDAALAFRDKPDRLSALKPLVPGPAPAGDAYASALHFIAIATIYGETK